MKCMTFLKMIKKALTEPYFNECVKLNTKNHSHYGVAY